ncbi:unnamed protein product [Allacma fusca]|uniref:Peptidase S1 domain-containing protein n=1 Tax=Allacma fusca TaxID=39272 RepID=A0A8J2JQU2_9HEXA|nr:unnamed protein product [Allacma fusca]
MKLSNVLVMVVISLCAKIVQVTSQEKIVGGVDAKPGQFPWQISLQLFFKGNWTHACGGSIIDKKHVLSAGHCVVDDTNKKHYRVIAGAHDISKESEPSRQTMDVCHISLHPNWTIYNHWDLSLVTLTKPLVYNDRVRPIRLAPVGADPEGQVCTTSGWGYRFYPEKKANAGNTSDILQFINVTIMNQKECGDILYPRHVSEICAYDPEGIRSPCFGDSGGPMACYDDKGPYLAGGVSWGRKCDKARSHIREYAWGSLLTDTTNLELLIRKAHHCFW